MIKTVKVIIILMVSLIFLYACQPNPDNSAVVNKGDDTLDKMIKQTATPATPSDTPAEAAYEYEKFQLEDQKYNTNTMIVDAIIRKPLIAQCPVISVKSRDFESGDPIKNIAEAIYPGIPLYAYNGGVLAKSNMEQGLINVKKDIADLENKIAAETDSEKLKMWNRNLSQYKGYAQYLEDELRKTQDIEASNEAPVYNFKETDTGSYSVGLQLTVNEKLFAEIDFVNAKDSNGLYVSTNTNIQNSAKYFTPEQMIADYGDDFRKSKEIADALVERMGIDYMELNVVSIGSYLESTGYCFFYTRSYNGFQESFTNYYVGTTATETERNLWNPECLAIDVFEEQITYVKWENPSELIEVENDNVQTLSFDEIKKVFLKQTDRIFSNDPFLENAVIKVKRAELGLTKILKKNSKNDYRLVPTWSFFALIDNGETEEFIWEKCILTINAVDGSIIDRGLMY